MKTAEITLKLKVNFQDDYDYLWVEELKKDIGKILYLYGYNYTGNLRLADRPPNKTAMWNDKLYMPDVVPVVIKEVKDIDEKSES